MSPENDRCQHTVDQAQQIRDLVHDLLKRRVRSLTVSITEFGIILDISKIIATSSDPVKACLEYLEVNEADLIVLSVQQREGLMRWLGKMTGEKISLGARQTTLFLPAGRSRFINPETGDVHLKSILIPVVKKPRSDTSIEFVKRLIKSLDLFAGSVTLLHVAHQKRCLS